MELQLRRYSAVSSKRLEQLFEDLELKLKDSRYASEATAELYDKFRVFFTQFGKPTFELREVMEDTPPWAQDVNLMLSEIHADLHTIFEELRVLAFGVQAALTNAIVETEGVKGLIDNADRLLDAFELYNDEFSDDLYLGDTFDDTSLVSEATCEIDTTQGLISLAVIEKQNWAPFGRVTAHGGSKNAFPGNTLQGVTPLPQVMPEMPTIDPGDISVGVQDSASDTTIIEDNQVDLAGAVRGENKYPSAVNDNNPESIFEYEMMVVPNHVSIGVPPDKNSLRFGFWNADDRLNVSSVIGTAIQRLRDAGGDENIFSRHPMQVTPTPEPYNPLLPAHSNNPTVKIHSDEGHSYTMGHDWKLRLTQDEDIYRVRFVDKDWVPDGTTEMGVNIEIELPIARTVSQIVIDPAILQNIDGDYLGADHFVLEDIGFHTHPLEDEPGISQLIWASDLGVDVPIEIREVKTVSFPQQRIDSAVLYFKSKDPYPCLVAHPFIEREMLLTFQWEQPYMLRVRHMRLDAWVADRYPVTAPFMGEVYPMYWARDENKIISDEMATFIVGLYAGAGNLGGDFAGIANHAGYGAGSGTVVNNMMNQLHNIPGLTPEQRERLPGPIPQPRDGLGTPPPGVTHRANTRFLLYGMVDYSGDPAVRLNLRDQDFEEALQWINDSNPVTNGRRFQPSRRPQQFVDVFRGQESLGIERFPEGEVMTQGELSAQIQRERSSMEAEGFITEGIYLEARGTELQSGLRGTVYSVVCVIEFRHRNDVQGTGITADRYYESRPGGPLGYTVSGAGSIPSAPSAQSQWGLGYFDQLYGGIQRPQTSQIGSVGTGLSAINGMGMSSDSNVDSPSPSNITSLGPSPFDALGLLGGGAQTPSGGVTSGLRDTGAALGAPGESEGGGAGGLSDIAGGLSSLMDKLTAGFASKIMSIAGAFLADTINDFARVLTDLFRGARAPTLVSAVPTQQRIRYGLEGFPAFRYWIALREIRLESNLYVQASHMVSEWFAADQGIERLHILSEEDLPQSMEGGGWVKYFVQFAPEEEWYEVAPLHDLASDLPRFLEVNPSVPVSVPDFRTVTRVDTDNNPLETKRVRVRIELTRPESNMFVSPRVLNYKLGIRTAS